MSEIIYSVKFFVSGIIAWLVIWCAGAIFLTSPTLYRYDARLGFAPRAGGSYKQERQENWVTNYFGELGFGKEEQNRLHSSKPKIVIYGDSYIEAAMIPGAFQMQNLVSCRGFDALGMGYSGIGAPEYCFLMRRLPLVTKGIRWHVIFVGDVYDFRGVDPLTCLKDTPGALPVKSSSLLDSISAKYRLFSLRAIMRQWKRNKLDWLGNNWMKRKQDMPAYDREEDRLSDICLLLKQAAHKNAPESRLLIVYAPTIPRIHQGEVLFAPEDITFGDELKTVCEKNNIDFINLGEDFRAYYKRTGKFPRGFFNTPPGEGHLNEKGTAIAAAVITRYIDERP